jgi:thiol-disulfide isomerase/thioredoxin
MKKHLFSLLIVLTTFTNYADENWLTSFVDAKQLALGTNKLILVDFWATWCGPCKRMDSESWSKEDVQLLMDNYVPVKIDIDRNKGLAQQYGVRGIPYIFIMDGNGKVLYSQMSYKRKNEVIDLLKKYALNTSYLSSDLINFHKKETFTTAFRLGVKYQDYSLHIGDSIKSDVLNVADIYFEDARDYLKSSDLKNKNLFEQKLDLFEIQEYLILHKPEKALKSLNKLNANDILASNKSFYSFLLYVSYLELNDQTNATNLQKDISNAERKKAELFIKTI